MAGLARSWWGKAWESNMESYSDFSNRLPRGRSYARGGSVSSMRIEKGLVTAAVQGSRSKPYLVKVSMDPLDSAGTGTLSEACAGRISTMDALMNGDFPEEVGSTLLSQKGLFPRSDQIRFSCSCPDGAYMCKHVAAVMYRIGMEFDRDPSLFFLLRGIDSEELVGRAAESRLEAMLRNAGRPSDRIIGSDRMKELFGLDMDYGDVSEEFPEEIPAVPRTHTVGERVDEESCWSEDDWDDDEDDDDWDDDDEDDWDDEEEEDGEVWELVRVVPAVREAGRSPIGTVASRVAMYADYCYVQSFGGTISSVTVKEVRRVLGESPSSLDDVADALVGVVIGLLSSKSFPMSGLMPDHIVECVFDIAEEELAGTDLIDGFRGMRSDAWRTGHREFLYRMLDSYVG